MIDSQVSTDRCQLQIEGIITFILISSKREFFQIFIPFSCWL